MIVYSVINIVFFICNIVALIIIFNKYKKMAISSQIETTPQVQEIKTKDEKDIVAE